MKTAMFLLMIAAALVGCVTLFTAIAVATDPNGGKFHLVVINVILTGYAWLVCVPWANTLRKEFRDAKKT